MSPPNLSRAKSVLVAASVAACILGASGVALAGDNCQDKTLASSTVTSHVQPYSANSVRVSYRDLDLASASGSRVLEERITRAARHVCAASDIRNLKEVAAEGSCEREAVSNALADVHSAHPGAQYAMVLTRR
jgi:UrcA family protein